MERLADDACSISETIEKEIKAIRQLESGLLDNKVFSSAFFRAHSVNGIDKLLPVTIFFNLFTCELNDMLLTLIGRK